VNFALNHAFSRVCHVRENPAGDKVCLSSAVPFESNRAKEHSDFRALALDVSSRFFYVSIGPAVRTELRFKISKGLIVELGWLAYKRGSFWVQQKVEEP
jgi:hypothetical protein